MTMKMNYYNKKCLGCGEFFSKDEKSPNFVQNPKKDTLYCKRCFRLKNYGILENNYVNDDLINKNLSNIDFSLGSIVLVVDIFNIKDSLLSQFKDNKNLLIVVNKINLLSKYKKIVNVMENINNYIKSLGWNQEIIFYDSVNKFNIKNINNWIIKESKLKRKIYVCGKTNVGKSSLINALLKFNNKSANLSVSAIKNTTLNLQKINLDKNVYVIDTPGFQNENNFLSIIDSKVKFDFKKAILKSYALKDNNQVFFLESIARIECTKIYKDLNSSISFLIMDNFKIHRTNNKNKEKIIEKSNLFFNVFLNKDYELKETVFQNLDKDSKYNIFLNGIGIIVVKNVQEIKINFPKHFQIELLKNFII